MIRSKIKWLSFCLILVLTLIITVFINQKHSPENIEKITNSIEADDSDLDINWDRYQTVNIELKDNVIISESGTYHLTGTLEDGQIRINAGVGKVRLILDNATVHNNSGPAILCSSANELVIETNGNSSLEDGNLYNENDDDISGVIYSKSDMTLQGEGTLNIVANYQDGIVGKDDVKFNSGIYNINSKDDGIRGKNSVYIVGGNFIIESGADAIKTTNETDYNKGFVLIRNGNFDIKSSAKGIKATKSILIQDGKFAIETLDDSIHSDNYLGITNGDININSKDDGIHANDELIIENGEILIAGAYEGIESQKVTIMGGKINIHAIDDGINAGGEPETNTSSRISDCSISISGGNIYINSSGDGIDSNGWLNISGGDIIIDGPTNNKNGALDSEFNIIMNGGSVMALGSSEMAKTLGSTSKIFNISVYFPTMYPANTNIEIRDSAGEVIMSHTSAKSFNHITAGSKDFKIGYSYTIFINDEIYQTFVVSNTTTTIKN